MAADTPDSISFVPSRVDGLDAVSLITVEPIRITFVCRTSPRVFLFADFGHPVGSFFSRVVDRMMFRRPWRIIGERDWFHPPPDRFFRFYTDPQITVYMPTDDVREYGPSVFCRVQWVWRAGRFDTWDLG